MSLESHTGSGTSTERTRDPVVSLIRNGDSSNAPPDMLRKLPLHHAFHADNEETYVLEAMRSSATQGDGPFTRRCHTLLEAMLDTPRALLTTSCTTALEMAAILARRVPPGAPAGDVICPAYTFMSTASAFILHGYRPVFADVQDDTLNLDPRHVESLITPETRAIAVVHYAGVPADMNALRAIAERHDIALIEDAAHAIFARYRGRPVGSLGDLAAFSFHATKNFTCGEGGALTINDDELIARAEYIRDKGSNREEFRRGKVERYSWVDFGGSYLLSDMLAAQLLAQFEAREQISNVRASCYGRYMEGLADVEQAGNLRLPTIPSDVESAHHIFHVRLKDESTRDALSAHLREEGIVAFFHYPALHLTPKGREYGPAEGGLPVAEAAAGDLLRLPLHASLTLNDVDRVIDSVRRFFAV